MRSLLFIITLLTVLSCEAQIGVIPVSSNNKKPATAQDYISQINNNRSVNLGVYIQHINDAGSITDRIWSPYDNRYAQVWDIAKELSDNYINMQNSGIAEYFRIQNPTSTSGSFTNLESDGGIAYTTQIGATITVTFVGNEISFRYWSSPSGGLWHFVVDGGASVDISVWHAVGETRRVNLFTGLSSDSHTVVGTFMGIDPAHSVGTPYGTLYASNQDGTTGNGYNIDRRSFYIVGSDEPNYCLERNATISAERAKTYFLTTGHWELSYRGTDNFPTDDGESIPRHGGGVSDPGSVTFANLDTDRTLKLDGGSNWFLNTTLGFSLATHADEIVLYQIFQGHNWTKQLPEICGFVLNMKFSQDGLDYTVSNTALVDQVMQINYGTMMGPNLMADKLLYNGNSEFDMVPENLDEPVTDVRGWDGTMATVASTGSDLLKSFCSGYRLVDPYESMVLEDDIGQLLFANNIGVAGNKIYPLMASPNTSILAGRTWTWHCFYNFGVISDAYNVLKN